MDKTVAGVLAYLEELCAEGIYCGGGQAYASALGAPIIDIAFGADGLGKPYETDSISSIYCAGKPLLALVIGHHVASGALTFETELGDLLKFRSGSPLANLRITHLLSHSAGLQDFKAVDAVLTPGSSMDEAIGAMQPATGFSVGRDTAYAEYAGWHLLARVCEALDARDYREQIQEIVLGPFGIDNEFVLAVTEPEWKRVFDRIRVNESFRGGERFPMLLERTAMWGTRWDPAFGVKGCARGLGHFYEGLQRVIDRERSDDWRLVDLVSQRSAPAYDSSMGRVCSYSLGFMSDLEDHEFGAMWSSNSVGHSGNVGMTAAGVDFDNKVVVAFHLSGLSDSQSAVSYLRPVIMGKIAQCLSFTGR